MTRPWTLLAVCLLGATAVAQEAAPPPAAFENVTVIPMDAERTLPGQTVVVQGRRIVALGGAAATPVPDGARRIDGRGKFLIPGLAEMHGHFLAPQQIQQYGEDYADRLLFLFLATRVVESRRWR